MSERDAIELTLLPRDDGGLRIYSTTDPGLILSGSDPRQVLSMPIRFAPTHTRAR